MPRLTARALDAPYAFCISPGEMMNAGPRAINHVQPEPGPLECKKSPNVDGTFEFAKMPLMPPAFPKMIGSAALKPQSSTTSCTAFTHVEPNRPPDTNVAVMTSALIIVPTQRGTPATTVSTAAPAMS